MNFSRCKHMRLSPAADPYVPQHTHRQHCLPPPLLIINSSFISWTTITITRSVEMCNLKWNRNWHQAPVLPPWPPCLPPPLPLSITIERLSERSKATHMTGVFNSRQKYHTPTLPLPKILTVGSATTKRHIRAHRYLAREDYQITCPELERHLAHSATPSVKHCTHVPGACLNKRRPKTSYKKKYFKSNNNKTKKAIHLHLACRTSQLFFFSFLFLYFFIFYLFFLSLGWILKYQITTYLTNRLRSLRVATRCDWLGGGGGGGWCGYLTILFNLRGFIFWSVNNYHNRNRVNLGSLGFSIRPLL